MRSRSHDVVTMCGIAVVIPNIASYTARICQEIANFDIYGANYRPTVFENSIKLAAAPLFPTMGGADYLPLRRYGDLMSESSGRSSD